MSQETPIYGDHDMLERQIGQNLQRYRLDQNLNQTELAKKAGLSRRTITSIENGNGSTLGTLIRILRALKKEHLLQELLSKPPISPAKLHEANLILNKTRKHASKPRKPKKPSTFTWADRTDS